MQRIGIDVDGVLADFNTAFASVLAKHSGRLLDLSKDENGYFWPDEWSWEYAALKKAGYGLEQSRDIIQACWDEVKEDQFFWLSLRAYLETREFLEALRKLEADIYFITNRPGIKAKEQTEGWLLLNGFPQATVLISADKGLCAQALDLHYYIDDKPENSVKVFEQSALTGSYLLNRPWNTESEYHERVSSVFQFLFEIKD